MDGCGFCKMYTMTSRTHELFKQGWYLREVFGVYGVNGNGLGFLGLQKVKGVRDKGSEFVILRM